MTRFRDSGQDTRPCRARVIAHYLPQYHPTPENDEWWGPGFTEWTAVAASRPRFRDHEQPQLPGELGFYDLRLPETRQAQADLAVKHGVEAFCYWHYWFEGRRILERPFAEVLQSGEPDFPFCLAWANHSWTRIWSGRSDIDLITQTYPGPEDHQQHFATLEPAFHDPRYLTVDGQPLFFLFRPAEVPDLESTIELWKDLAKRSGLPGLYIVGRVDSHWYPSESERVAKVLDAVNDYTLGPLFPNPSSLWNRGRQRFRLRPQRTSYMNAIDRIPRAFSGFRNHPSVLPGWDSTPRHGDRGVVLEGRDPAAFANMVDGALKLVTSNPEEERIIFLKSWNEWAEGNFIEPDTKFGRAFLEALADRILIQ